MKLLKSRVPYLTDEAWTALVRERMEKEEFDSSLPIGERIKATEVILANVKKSESVGLSEEEIDMQQGASSEVSIGEAILIREEFHKTNSEEGLSETFGMSKELISKILDGTIWPYAGGPMKPPVLSGLNEKTSGYTANQRRFIRGAISLAKRELSDTHFEIFCHNNGMTVPEATQLVKNLEPRNARLSQQRYRDVLVRHSAGQSVEKSIVGYKRRARKTAD